MKAVAVIYVIMSALLVSFLVATGIANAHQSGCHRWHSCPSDSGGYVCGDTGYSSECGGYTTIYETPDYESEGNDNGQEHADNDESDIASAASSEASGEGYRDGLENYEGYSGPDASGACEKSFTFETPQPSEYEDAYTARYRERCVEIYNSAYEVSYDDSFVLGEEAKTDHEAESSDEITVSSGDFSWLWFYGALGSLGTFGWYLSRRK